MTPQAHKHPTCDPDVAKNPSRGAPSTTPSAKRRRRTPLHEAKVKILADDPGSVSETPIDNHILDRLRKCIEKANHPNTSEAEAKAALFLSSKLMSQYNVSMADVLNTDAQANRSQNHAGRSVVEIKNIRESRSRATKEAFVRHVAAAMKLFFDCKYYSARESGTITWTFYGIAQNTVSAALAFEMVYNLISHWACDYKGGSTAYSYSMGVAKGLKTMAREEKRIEADLARKGEAQRLAAEESHHQIRRQQELERLRCSNQFGMKETETYPLPQANVNDPIENFASNGDYDCEHGLDYFMPLKREPSADVETPDLEEEAKLDFPMEDTDAIDPLGNLDEQIAKLVKTESSDIQDRAPQTSGSAWASEMQLVRFRTTAGKIADDFMKAQGIKLSRRSRREAAVRDRNAFLQGKKDSKTINVRQNRLE
ncbi:hypothetical protein PRK78_004118 [Emydomyces testavorans]|uniref:DUF2786 domain-containing protein n=1 Tax=Emydomyces testavorans TaxID=2070801 RepID=A0AAF0DHI1_9EURO|nr:hypothetical protein PRK78_004118 [Emydomyces testavorans]